MVYFVDSGMVSLRVVAGGSLLETAIVGYRGAVGISSVFGTHVPNHQSVVLFPGSALSITSEDLRRVMVERPLIRANLASYAQALVVHGSQSALCGVRHGLEQRLACWLCLACDAVDNQIFSVTHDYLSTVLGLPRAGVTRMLIRFEKQGLIRKMRGLVHVDNRKRLAQRACCCYSIIEGAYAAAHQLARMEREVQISS
ncbi:Crp/Fnr family transcriptional regulator [Bradyrhizobium sp. PMVTL-01]|uniref:Crp/Fnr family transcriptional regulator n=1 Tax=Bradyrhizobium sp. PMVTL-01 TaxID=3434999 RepID=UPI003F72AFFD